MNYKQLTTEMKVKIDFLLDEEKISMRAAARKLGISHSTISRYRNGIYKKREINIHEKYKDFIEYLYKNYDKKVKSIDVIVHIFKKYHPLKRCVTMQQVYNWINKGKIKIRVEHTCYKRHKKKTKGMMGHLENNLNEKTVLPIRLRPKYIEERDELGHLEIDSIIGKKNEKPSIISIVDRACRRMWLIKAEYRNEYYTSNLIFKYLTENEVVVRSITTDNGIEFESLGIAAKKLGVKLYKCDPYCSFERGTNERYNALVRRFIPKGRSMHMYSQQYLDDISFQFNNMPRKMFDYETPFDMEMKLIEKKPRHEAKKTNKPNKKRKKKNKKRR